MVFFRQYILPFCIVLVFLLALFVVSARNFLPGDMVAPAPIGVTSNGVTSIGMAPTGVMRA